MECPFHPGSSCKAASGDRCKQRRQCGDARGTAAVVVCTGVVGSCRPAAAGPACSYNIVILSTPHHCTVPYEACKLQHWYNAHMKPKYPTRKNNKSCKPFPRQGAISQGFAVHTTPDWHPQRAGEAMLFAPVALRSCCFSTSCMEVVVCKLIMKPRCCKERHRMHIQCPRICVCIPKLPCSPVSPSTVELGHVADTSHTKLPHNYTCQQCHEPSNSAQSRSIEPSVKSRLGSA